MVEKCAKFTATLIFLVQSLSTGRIYQKYRGDPANNQAVPARDNGIVPDASIQVIPPTGEVLPVNVPTNNGMDEAFADLMNFLPPNFNDFSASSGPFAMSELMDDFATGDLFW